MAGALQGIRVVDFGQYIAGPLAAMMLADEGAEVIHIDPPGGARMVTPANATWNRGKRCMVLDLKKPADLGIALDLVRQADVLIENFRPGVMEALGLGAGEMLARNPRLVYCSMPGFAADDPRAAMAAWEGVVAAATDTYRPLPSAPQGDPVYWDLPVASNFAALLASAACVMALVARERDGLGQRIEVPLFDAMFALIGARGMTMPQPVQLSFDFTGFGVYRCADGRCVHFAPVAPRFMDWFVAATGQEAWRDEGLLDRAQLAARPERASELRRRLVALFKTRTAAEWETLVNQAGAPLAMCRTMAEWLNTPHALASRAVVPVDDPEYGPMLQPGAAVRLSASPGPAATARQLCGDRAPPSFTPRPAVAAAPQAEAGSQAALAGLRVIDLTQIWAGPTAARMLAEFGADVIKVNSPHEPILTHEEVNRGKRTVLLDLRQADDLAVFFRLVDSADVVMQNFAHGVAERLGIGEDEIRRRRPDIVYASISAYGYEGPWHARRGYEVQAQAVVGAQVQFGSLEAAERLPYEINDYGTGILGAFAVGLAVLHRARTGQGQHVQAALTYTASLHQSLFLHDFTGKYRAAAAGSDKFCSGPLHRLYRGSDRWFFLGLHPDDKPTLDRVLGFLGVTHRPGQALAPLLQARFGEHPAQHWVDRLVALGAGAHALTSVGELMADPWVRSHGLSITRHHPGLGDVTTVGPVARLSRTPLRAGRAVSPPGGDRDSVMAELGDR